MSEKPWLAHYDSGVPHSLAPYPERTLLDCICDTACERPDHPFLLFKGRTLSYGEVEQLSNRFAAALVNEGVQKGDRVALILVNSPQTIIAQLGIWKAGGIAVPLNPLYSDEELERALAHVGAKLAIVLTLCYSRLKQIQPRTAVQRVIATSIKDYLPRHLALLFTLTREKKEGHRITLAEGDIWFTKLLRTAPRERPPLTVRPDEAALLLFTGGTTGIPKAAICRHHDLLIAGMQGHSWTCSLLPDWDSVALQLMPLFHSYGIWVLATSIVARWPVALVPNPRDLDDVLATIRQTKPAVLPAVPTFYASLLEHARFKSEKQKVSLAKLCLSSAAPLLAETKKRFETATGSKLIEGYGLTESCAGVAGGPARGVYKPGSVGMPFPDVELRIVDADTGRDVLPAGAVGEITIRAPQNIHGYWESAPDTESMLRGGWLYTGDLGYLDEDGYVFVVDRKKDVIKASGFQVWPREVEEAIAAHAAVAQVGVAGVPDPRFGEAVKAWVVLNPGAQASADEIRAHCRKHLAAYKVPRQVEFRTSLPTSLIGKTLRRALRAEDASLSRSTAA